MAQRTTPEYDFYATAPPAPHAPAPTPSPFGQAAGSAVNQFGTPVGFGGAAPMTGPVALPVASRSRTSQGVQLPTWAWRWMATLAVAVVLGLFGVGRFAGIGGLFAGDLELPATLDGMAQDTTSGQAALMEGALAQVLSSSDGAVAALYSNGYASAAVLAIPEEASPTDVQLFFGHAAYSPTQRFGEVTCATFTAGPASVCLRSGDGRTVAVTHASTDFAETLALLGEAWGAI